MARAHAVGAPVLVLTVDLAVVGARHRDTRNGIAGRPSSVGQGRARSRPGLAPAAGSGTSRVGGKPLTFGNLEKAVPGARNPAAFRRGSTRSSTPASPGTTSPGSARTGPGKLIVKGVLDPEDARRAVEAGVDGIVVSNHGGRQLDAVPSTARALPEWSTRSATGRGAGRRRRPHRA